LGNQSRHAASSTRCKCRFDFFRAAVRRAYLMDHLGVNAQGLTSMMSPFVMTLRSMSVLSVNASRADFFAINPSKKKRSFCIERDNMTDLHFHADLIASERLVVRHLNSMGKLPLPYRNGIKIEIARLARSRSCF
jgi:hypothetical protein